MTELRSTSPPSIMITRSHVDEIFIMYRQFGLILVKLYGVTFKCQDGDDYLNDNKFIVSLYFS